MTDLNKIRPGGFNRQLYPIAVAAIAWLGYMAFGTGGAVVFGVVFIIALAVAMAVAQEDKETVSDDPNAGGFGNAADLDRAGLFSSTGIPIGWFDPEQRTNPRTGQRTEQQRLRYNGPRHLVTFGIPRTGKGTDIIIPTLLEYPGSILVLDPKGENAAVTAGQRQKLGHKVYIINPYNLHSDYLENKGENVLNRARFNPLYRLDIKAPGFVGEVRALAQALIVSTGQSVDSYWTDSARDLVTALIMHVCMVYPEREKNLETVRMLLAQPSGADEDGNPTGLASVIATMSSSTFLPIRQMSAQFVESSKDVMGIIRSAQQQLSFLDEPEVADSLKEANFHFADMKRQPITVYLVLPVEELSDKTRWLRLLVTAAINSLLRGGKGNTVLFLLDEFALLGHLKAVADVLGVASGLGVQLWPILQNLGQIKANYRDHWEGYLSTAGVVQYLSVNDKTTAGEVVNRCGRVRRWVPSQSTRDVSKREREEGLSGESSSRAEQWDDLLSPSYLYGLALDKQILFAAGSQKTFQVNRLSYLDERSGLSALADENPYHPQAIPVV